MSGLGWLPSNSEQHNGAAPPIAMRAAVLNIDEYTTGIEVRSSQARLEEAVGLARAIDLEVAFADSVRVRTRRPATLFGTGKLDEIAERIAALEISLVIVNDKLTPVQQRNLETAWKCKVIDRTGLILEIFGDRAQTREGMLQVELAHLSYQQSRLVRSWTHLERQRGGFGFLGGPGETQIETDRRLIRDRIAKIKSELEKVERTRGLHRKSRKRSDIPVISLVGYTNAGKSTLFNQLSGADVLAKDMLFATLDPTLRRIELPKVGPVILSDTVGFISDLPTELVVAFRATLEEVTAADIILHVRDIAHEDSDAQKQDVMAVLDMLGVTAGQGPPIIEVQNKIDLLPQESRTEILQRTAKTRGVVAISALDHASLVALCEELAAYLGSAKRLYQLYVRAGDGGRIAWLHEHAEVIEQSLQNETLDISARMTADVFARYEKRFPA